MPDSWLDDGALSNILKMNSLIFINNNPQFFCRCEYVCLLADKQAVSINLFFEETWIKKWVTSLQGKETLKKSPGLITSQGAFCRFIILFRNRKF